MVHEGREGFVPRSRSDSIDRIQGTDRKRHAPSALARTTRASVRNGSNVRKGGIGTDSGCLFCFVRETGWIETRDDLAGRFGLFSSNPFAWDETYCA